MPVVQVQLRFPFGKRVAVDHRLAKRLQRGAAVMEEFADWLLGNPLAADLQKNLRRWLHVAQT